jgi:hypothetical protein
MMSIELLATLEGFIPEEFMQTNYENTIKELVFD